MADDLVKDALDYHRRVPAGKLEIAATKPMANQRDLALAYSPGVAEACKIITDNPAEAATVTAAAASRERIMVLSYLIQSCVYRNVTQQWHRGFD